jgi:hypothetical protein
METRNRRMVEKSMARVTILGAVILNVRFLVYSKIECLVLDVGAVLFEMTGGGKQVGDRPGDIYITM